MGCNNSPLWTDIVGVIIAVLSFIISACALGISHQSLRVSTKLAAEANRLANTQAQTAQAALEAQLRAAIADALDKMRAAGTDFSQHPEDDVLRAAYITSQEMYCNAYEDACAKYNERRIDAGSFERQYYYEIRSLVENKHFRAFYFPYNKSKYVETVKIYTDWFVLMRVDPPR